MQQAEMWSSSMHKNLDFSVSLKFITVASCFCRVRPPFYIGCNLFENTELHDALHIYRIKSILTYLDRIVWLVLNF